MLCRNGKIYFLNFNSTCFVFFVRFNALHALQVIKWYDKQLDLVLLSPSFSLGFSHHSKFLSEYFVQKPFVEFRKIIAFHQDRRFYSEYKMKINFVIESCKFSEWNYWYFKILWTKIKCNFLNFDFLIEFRCE
jgi:hypothetical protein